jgi:hypothetical protein
MKFRDPKKNAYYCRRKAEQHALAETDARLQCIRGSQGAREFITETDRASAFGCHSLSWSLENGSWPGVAIASTESSHRLRHIVSLSVTD